ncbi:MAG: hypothetical protein LBP40_04025 [Campylobacteraceae bacterium]|jgi:hypothetical protein|nr:hypothetical protein [Campylobacteraceae bacterium]
MKVFEFWRFLIRTNFYKYSKDDYSNFGFDTNLTITPKSDKLSVCPFVWDFEIRVRIWRYEFEIFIAQKVKR